jgi:hypothetical protein
LREVVRTGVKSTAETERRQRASDLVHAGASGRSASAHQAKSQGDRARDHAFTEEQPVTPAFHDLGPRLRLNAQIISPWSEAEDAELTAVVADRASARLELPVAVVG